VAARSSCSCLWVVVIMFSLTTAVRMESSVQELATRKKTKAKRTVGTLPMRPSTAVASSTDSAPFMRRKSRNMLSGTVAKGSVMKPSGDSEPKMRPWPTRRVARMPTA